MIGMLIFNRTRCQHDARAKAAQNARQPDGVSGAHLKVRIAFKKD
jgi:hypothetical protein